MSNEVTPLKAALEKFMSQHRHKAKLVQTNIRENWSKIAGNTIASRTEKLWIKEGKLHIVINSSVLKAELQFHKEVLVTKINQELNSTFVQEIIIH